MDNPPLAASVSLEQRIGLPGYGHASCFLSVSNVTLDTTPEDLDAMLDQAKLAWTAIATRIRSKVAEIKSEAGI